MNKYLLILTLPLLFVTCLGSSREDLGYWETELALPRRTIAPTFTVFDGSGTKDLGRFFIVHDDNEIFAQRFGERKCCTFDVKENDDGLLYLSSDTTLREPIRKVSVVSLESRMDSAIDSVRKKLDRIKEFLTQEILRADLLQSLSPGKQRFEVSFLSDDPSERLSALLVMIKGEENQVYAAVEYQGNFKLFYCYFSDDVYPSIMETSELLAHELYAEKDLIFIQSISDLPPGMRSSHPSLLLFVFRETNNVERLLEWCRERSLREPLMGK